MALWWNGAPRKFTFLRTVFITQVAFMKASEVTAELCSSSQSTQNDYFHPPQTSVSMYRSQKKR
jgi:hypothetical protein